ncbi:MAG: hypothetical protein LBU16_06460 [Treponema sp.]|jgi:hypothetical protein|nr:hypothetical protein [Treponema sp.]
MGRGILKTFIGYLDKAARQLPDGREAGNGLKYAIADALKSALAVFYFLHPSLLNFQQEMRRKTKRSNLESLFGVRTIPCTEQIKNIVNGIEPGSLAGVFGEGLKTADEQGVLKEYRVLDGGVLIALDGVWYHSSETIHCDHCLRRTKDGKTLYYHSMLGTAIVRPGSNVVLPLMPEYIRNEDGNEKQDCERNAAKRCREERGAGLAWLKPTFLGDDLYACHGICSQIHGLGMSYIFTCKAESRPWIAEQVAWGELESYTRREWNGRNHLEYRRQWANGLENRSEGEQLSVNYLVLEIWNEKKQKISYKNSWITDKELRKDTVERIAECGRARWQLENEANNVLKNRGYNLKHNFGHGKNHASELFCLLNVLSYLIHGIQDMADEEYRKARGAFGRRDAFFGALRYEMSRYLHTDWTDFLLAIAGEAPDDS